MKNDYKQAYYENKELWDIVAWQARAVDFERARLAADWLPGEAASVLDVGCGNGVYTNIAEARGLKVGLDRSRIALEYLTAPAIQADASAIPFQNGAFDACVSMEMLEHLPDSIYTRSLGEVMRVAKRYILISVPYREKLKHNLVICPTCQSKFHPYHHVREYLLADLQMLFEPQFSLMRYTAIVPRKTEIFPGLWNIYRTYQHRRGKNFPSRVVCPNCGYAWKESPVPQEDTSSIKPRQSNFRNWWPKLTTYTWWLALYRIRK